MLQSRKMRENECLCSKICRRSTYRESNITPVVKTNKRCWNILFENYGKFMTIFFGVAYIIGYVKSACFLDGFKVNINPFDIYTKESFLISGMTTLGTGLVFPLGLILIGFFVGSICRGLKLPFALILFVPCCEIAVIIMSYIFTDKSVLLAWSVIGTLILMCFYTLLELGQSIRCESKKNNESIGFAVALKKAVNMMLNWKGIKDYFLAKRDISYGAFPAIAFNLSLYFLIYISMLPMTIHILPLSVANQTGIARVLELLVSVIVVSGVLAGMYLEKKERGFIIISGILTVLFLCCFVFTIISDIQELSKNNVSISWAQQSGARGIIKTEMSMSPASEKDGQGYFVTRGVLLSINNNIYYFVPLKSNQNDEQKKDNEQEYLPMCGVPSPKVLDFMCEEKEVNKLSQVTNISEK